MKIERTKNSIRNLWWGVLNKLISLLCPFLIRTAMIYSLGSQYLGLSSLFTSILQVLGLAELGFASAIVYSMYEPIAKDDKETICALMQLYKRIYRIIGVIVLTIGLLLIPFLKYIVNMQTVPGINVYVLYLIYLFNSVVSYFMFAYKNCLLNAHQRLDIISNVTSAFYLAMYVVQFCGLVFFKNYYVYVLVIPVTTMLINIVNAYYASKMFPQYVCHGSLPKSKIVSIKRQVVGLMMNKVCQVSRNSFDSIVISAFLGLTMVAIYNNYFYIMSAITGFMVIISNSILAGVGNSISVDTQEKNFHDMEKFLFLYMWIAGWCTCCLACLYQPFMELWVGKSLVLPYYAMFLFCLYFYCLHMGVIRGVYYDAAGLWWYGKYRALAEAALNIVLNIVLGKLWGIVGIILATLISLILINYIYGSHFLFKYYFTEYKVSTYFKQNGLYMFVTFVVAAITYFVCSYIPFGETTAQRILMLIFRGIICVVLPNFLYGLAYQRNKQFVFSKIWIKGKLKNFR